MEYIHYFWFKKSLSDSLWGFVTYESLMMNSKPLNCILHMTHWVLITLYNYEDLENKKGGLK